MMAVGRLNVTLKIVPAVGDLSGVNALIFQNEGEETVRFYLTGLTGNITGIPTFPETVTL